MAVNVQARCAREIAVGEDGALPTEFQLFAAGENPNYNADAQGLPQPVFTARSAKTLQADAARKGTDYFMDLEHASVDEKTKRARSDATDAMCWFQIQTRADGSAWAVNVRWTPEGERRLRAKSQRYISPVFYFDGETGEITEFCNCALTSDPATYGIAPLVAASRVANVNERATPASLAIRTLLRAAVEKRLAKALRKR